MKFAESIARVWLGILCLATAVPVSAGPQSLCVFDLLGANGPTYSFMKDYNAAALNWGVEFTLKPYTSEHIAVEDLKSGLCDAAVMTGIRSRQFNAFTGSLDAIGALPTYELLKAVIATVSTPKAAKLMVSGSYEVGGIFPAGAAYLFTSDRNIDTVGELAGKRIAILDVDPAQVDMVAFVGASPVGTSLADMYSKFNNGSVDITFGPAMVYEAMELHKGLDAKGGIIQFPLTQLSMQVLLRSDKFPEGFGQKSREFFLSQFDQLVKTATGYDKTIPEKLWIPLPEADKTGYAEVFRQARIRLRDKGIYEAKMLTVMRRSRCEKAPQMPECTAADKE